MIKVIAVSAFIFAAGLGNSVQPSEAANARHPYQNVNHRNDRGNDTGNAGTARLNDEQMASIRSDGTMSMGPGGHDLGTDQKTLSGQK